MKISNKEGKEFFDANEYLIINSDRRSGKTGLLKSIIESNPSSKIIVRCPTYKMFNDVYAKYINCEYDEYNNKTGDIIIGDEVYVPPSKYYRTACALTNRYRVFSLIRNNDLNLNEIVFVV